MANSTLKEYVQTARSKNLSDEVIKQELLKQGWKDSDLEDAFREEAKNTLDLPTPPVPRLSMWIAFEYFFLFFCLYISLLSFSGICYFAVDKFFPSDNMATGTSSFYLQFILPVYVSSLLVSYPIFALLLINTRRQVLAKPRIRNLETRKKLIYITMGIILLVTLFAFFQTLFQTITNSVNINSLLHFLVTFCISAPVFIYMLYSVREDRRLND